MLDGQKIVVVMPAYNAARTLQRTYDEVVAQGIVALVIVVDDASHDATVAIARTLSVCGWRFIRKSRLRRKSKNLLSPRTGRGCGHYHYDSPRLSAHAAVNPGNGCSGGKRTLSRRAWFAHSWRRCAAWRYAFVEIHLEPVFDAC
jgi:cellulose synthase/poly-beta-1,6-N-acetylglucosamine synthase-like glycosyltransferase